MERAFTGKLKPLLDTIAEEMDLYVPTTVGSEYVYGRYESGSDAEYNNIRACTPAKEFLFPLRELAAVFPEPADPGDVKPFAVFGLKACDLKSMDLLDKVFLEGEFSDELYGARRRNMVVISSDCNDPSESCFCNVLGGEPFAAAGFDLNVVRIKDGFVVEAGSQRGRDLLKRDSGLFADVPDSLLGERDEKRAATKRLLDEQNAEYKPAAGVGEIVAKGYESEVFEDEAATCVECQACTRVCPTCHCFYLYDTKQKDYFGKMKMWDSCMRMDYARVAGGENPRKRLGDRLRHRLMHKFSYFLERYGVDMCVGCGRCVDAEAGGVDIRVVLKRLNEEFTGQDKRETEAAI